METSPWVKAAATQAYQRCQACGLALSAATPPAAVATTKPARSPIQQTAHDTAKEPTKKQERPFMQEPATEEERLWAATVSAHRPEPAARFIRPLLRPFIRERTTPTSAPSSLTPIGAVSAMP